MTLTLITAPATEPVTLAEAKAYCRVEHALDDTLITALTALNSKITTLRAFHP